MEKDYTTAARWAEDELQLDPASTTALRGSRAAQSGDELLKRAGRPPLDPAAARGQRSPQRTLRLTPALDAKLKNLAAARQLSPSDVIRTALTEYLDQHQPS